MLDNAASGTFRMVFQRIAANGPLIRDYVDAAYYKACTEVITDRRIKLQFLQSYRAFSES